MRDVALAADTGTRAHSEAGASLGTPDAPSGDPAVTELPSGATRADGRADPPRRAFWSAAERSALSAPARPAVDDGHDTDDSAADVEARPVAWNPDASDPLRDVLGHLLAGAAASVLRRRAREGTRCGRVRVTSVTGREPLLVSDDGLGLHPSQVRALLTASVSGVDALEALAGVAEDESTPDVPDLASSLRTCLLVGEDVEVRSRPAGHPEAATLRVTVSADGRARLSLKGVTVQQSGTEIRLHADRPHRAALGAELLVDVVRDLVAGWPVSVEVDGVPVNDAPIEDGPVEEVEEESDLDAFLAQAAEQNVAEDEVGSDDVDGSDDEVAESRPVLSLVPDPEPDPDPEPEIEPEPEPDVVEQQRTEKVRPVVEPDPVVDRATEPDLRVVPDEPAPIFVVSPPEPEPPVAPATPQPAVPPAAPGPRYADLLGVEPLAVLELEPGPGGLGAVAAFLPAGVVPEHVVQLHGQRIARLPSGLVPQWMTMCALVVDLTTVGSGGDDASVREHFGRALHPAMVRLAGRDSLRFAALVLAHPTALATAAANTQG